MQKENKENIKKIFQSELKSGSVGQYLWHLGQYFEYLNSEGLSLDTIENPMKTIQEYINSQTIESDNPWIKSTVNLAFYALKKFWEKTQYRLIDKRFFTNTGEETEHEPRILGREEVQKVWHEANESLGETEQIMVHTGWESALRSGELVTLKGENITEDSTLEVRVLKTKNARKRVGLTPETYERLLGLGRAEGRYLFLHKIDGEYSNWRHYTSWEWSIFFRKWADKGVFKDGGIRWHDFARHTRLTHYAEDTKSFLAVLQLSGHQNPKVCRQYFERAKIEVPELKVIGKQDWSW